MHELSKRLADDMDVTVLCPSAKGAQRLERMDGVKVVRYRYAPNALETLVHNGGIVGNLASKPWKVALLPTFLLSQLFTALWLCLRSRPDVMHAHWLVPQGLVAAFLSLCLRRKVPFVVTCHGTDLWSFRGRIWEPIKRWAAREASVMAVVSKVMEDELANQVGQINNVVIAPMGVDLEKRFRPAFNGRPCTYQIITVGRLVESKGVEYLIGAMPELVHRFPAAAAVIVGDGPDRIRLERLAVQLGVTDHCEFLGKISNKELPDLYRSSSVFVAPFLQEGLGLVCIEALGCGCPVVASDIPALADIIEHSGKVHLVPARSRKAIISAVTEVFSNFDEELNGARRSHSRLSAKFGWNVVSEGYAAILRGAMTRN